VTAIPLRNEGLVLYKSRPARVVETTPERVRIETESGKDRKVRPKDVVPLHPGPLSSLGQLQPQTGEQLQSAWELLDAGDETDVPELAELLYGAYSPATAWSTWQLVADGLMFEGTPDLLKARPADEVTAERERRRVKAQEKERRTAFLDRVRAGRYETEDEILLRPLEELALGRLDQARQARAGILSELGRGESPENAHALLLELGRWNAARVPYPERLSVSVRSPRGDSSLPVLPDEDRLDLTHLDAFAIDDEGSRDADDAISIADGRIWVHIADVAAVVTPDSPADLMARERGANVYLPDGTVTMLPEAYTGLLALGMSDRSPALSFAIDISSTGELTGVDVAATWVRVQRLTYAQAEERLSVPGPLSQLRQLTDLCRDRRRLRGAVFIDFPEAKIRVNLDGEEPAIDIAVLGDRVSRDMVAEAMILAGESAAHFALEQELPFPFATQPPPREEREAGAQTQGLAAMYAWRRQQVPGKVQAANAPHSGLGLEAYARTTSPLRRYLDLVVHQQLRASVTGSDLLDEAAILERLGAVTAMAGNLRQVERLTNRHWTMVYLMQRPGWRGQGILLDQRRTRGVVVIPELALELDVHLPKELPLDSELPLLLGSVDLPRLNAHFRVEE
jgi:exoribonuclease-2